MRGEMEGYNCLSKDRKPEPGRSPSSSELPSDLRDPSISDEHLMSLSRYIIVRRYRWYLRSISLVHYLPLASLHFEISVSVGTRPRFANSILASFRTAASSIR